MIESIKMHYFTIKNYYLLYILTTNNISNMISKDTINVNRKYKFNLRRLFMKRKRVALTMAAVMILSVAGCSSKPDAAENAKQTTADTQVTSTDVSAENTSSSGEGESVTLKLFWWGNQVRNDLTQQVIDLYMKNNPNVTIMPEFTDWNGYWDKLATSTAGGNMPDIIQMDYRYLEKYVSSNSLANLSEFINDGTIKTDKIPESVIESGSINGICYAVSLGSNAPAVFYDKEIVDKAGVTIPDQMTIEELYEIGQEIYEKTGVLTYYDGGSVLMGEIARSYGSHLWEELEAGDETAVKKDFEYIKKFSDAEFSIPQELLVEKNPQVVETKPIIDGTVWNDFSFSNQYSAMVAAAGRDFGMSMYPTTADATQQPIYLKPSQFFSVAETSQYKAEAAKFVNWITNSVEANEILQGERGVPVNTEVQEVVKEKLDSTNTQVFDFVAKVGEVATAIDAPDPAGSSDVNTKLNTYVENIRDGSMDVETAVKEFTEYAKRTLEEAKK